MWRQRQLHVCTCESSFSPKLMCVQVFQSAAEFQPKFSSSSTLWRDPNGRRWESFLSMTLRSSSKVTTSLCLKSFDLPFRRFSSSYSCFLFTSFVLLCFNFVEQWHRSQLLVKWTLHHDIFWIHLAAAYLNAHLWNLFLNHLSFLHFWNDFVFFDSL